MAVGVRVGGGGPAGGGGTGGAGGGDSLDVFGASTGGAALAGGVTAI
jgi:hypothetical protein